MTGNDHRVVSVGAWSSAPADAFLAADTGAFASLGGQDVGMPASDYTTTGDMTRPGLAVGRIPER